jgi:hypothetical protein
VLLIMQTFLSLIKKLANLMRRSTLQSHPLQLVFPEKTFTTFTVVINSANVFKTHLLPH